MKQGDEITLSKMEFFRGCQAGIMRRTASIYRGLIDRNGGFGKGPADLMYNNIVGALAEEAFSKGVNIHWPGEVNQKKIEADTGTDWQVRCVRQRHYGLIVRDDDPDNQKFALMLATDTDTTFIFGGWIDAKSAKQPQFKQDVGGHGVPCFLIPQKLLNKEL